MSGRPRPATPENRREQAERLWPRISEVYSDLTLSLDYENALELLVATILSAQCTDERVNQVTKTLFPKYPDPVAYAEVDREELEEDIRPTGFYRNKARHIQTMAAMLVDEHEGRVPSEMEELIRLPGVARKTANVVLSNAFGRHEGVVVDTHVKRVSGRLGLTEQTDPVKVEQDLMQALPQERWHPFAWALILHGRRVCKARKPDCEACALADLCPSAGQFG